MRAPRVCGSVHGKPLSIHRHLHRIMHLDSQCKVWMSLKHISMVKLIVKQCSLPQGTIIPYAGNDIPSGWQRAHGQLFTGSTSSLSSLLASTFGCIGSSLSCSLPDLQGRVIVGAGQGPGLSLREIADAFGSENVTLLPSQMPWHSHLLWGMCDCPLFCCACV